MASITVYNSMVFGFFSNAQRFISKHRYGDGRHPCSMLDLTIASMLTGLVSVGLGAPVDLVKIRLQMQMQTILAGKSRALSGGGGGGVWAGSFNSDPIKVRSEQFKDITSQETLLFVYWSVQLTPLTPDFTWSLAWLYRAATGLCCASCLYAPNKSLKMAILPPITQTGSEKKFCINASAGGTSVFRR